MKTYKIILASMSISLFVISCKRDLPELKPLTSVLIGNFVTGGTDVKINGFSNNVATNSFSNFVVKEGSSRLYIYPSNDSLHPYYNNELATSRGDLNSFFIGGNSAQPDVLFIKEHIPYRIDSSAGIRFINLSAGGNAFNITLSSTPTVNEVTNLGYKQYTEFKSYPVLLTTVPYTFQIRDVATNSILASYSFNTFSNILPRFANITLVIRGLPFGSPALGVTRVNHDR